MDSMKRIVGVLFLIIGVFLFGSSYASDIDDDYELFAYKHEVDSELFDRIISFVKQFLTP